MDKCDCKKSKEKAWKFRDYLLWGRTIDDTRFVIKHLSECEECNRDFYAEVSPARRPWRYY